MPTPYSPGFFASLFGACASPDFYHRLHGIRFRRTLGFLTLFSLLFSVVLASLLFSYFQSNPLPREVIMETYDEVLPAFDGIYEKGILETIPNDFLVAFRFDGDGRLVTESSLHPDDFLVFSLNTEQSYQDFQFEKTDLPGLYAFRDGAGFASPQGVSFTPYKAYSADRELTFTKASLRPVLEASIPVLEQWISKTVLPYGIPFFFSYWFIGSFLIGILFFPIGIITLFLMRKPIRISFLLQLAIYAVIPAFSIAVITTLLGISVPFVPLLIFGAFYYYGLMQY